MKKKFTRKTDSRKVNIVPMLSVRRGAQAVDFYKVSFEAEELFRIENDSGDVVVQLSVKGSEFWVADESPDNSNFSPESLGGSSVRMIMIVDDPDTIFEKAISAGAKEIYPVSEQNGWRIGRIVDPFGHHWEIGKLL
ncbi:MAG: VOC family protein [Actinomycetota bacterium]